MALPAGFGDYESPPPPERIHFELVSELNAKDRKKVLFNDPFGHGAAAASEPHHPPALDWGWLLCSAKTGLEDCF